MKFFVLLFVVLMQFIFILTVPKAYATTTKVDLGTAGNFAVLGASAVNDTNPSVITGNVGLSPSAWPAPPVLTCLEVTGTIYSVDGAGPLPCRVADAGLLTIAKNDLTTAYNDAAARIVTSTIGTALGGETLKDGVYNSASTEFQIAANQE